MKPLLAQLGESCEYSKQCSWFDPVLICNHRTHKCECDKRLNIYLPYCEETDTDATLTFTYPTTASEDPTEDTENPTEDPENSTVGPENPIKGLEYGYKTIIIIVSVTICALLIIVAIAVTTYKLRG